MLKHSNHAFFALLFILCLSTQAIAGDIRILGHRVPPFSMHSENGKVSGFSSELFNLTFMGLPEFNPKGRNQHIIPVTFNRLYTELQQAEKRIGLTVGRNPTRAPMFKWVGPYIQLDLGVVAKKDRYFKIDKIDDFRGYKIGTIENTAPEQALLKLGLDKDILRRDLYPQRNLAKLQNNKIEFMAYPLQAISYLMKTNSIEANDYEEVFSLKKINLYFAFSKDFSDEDIARYQSRLDDVLKSEEFQKLRRKYALDSIQRHSGQ